LGVIGGGVDRVGGDGNSSDGLRDVFSMCWQDVSAAYSYWHTKSIMSTTTAAATTTITTETNENTSYRCGNDGGREGEGAEQQSGSKDIQLHVDVMRMRIYRRERKLMALSFKVARYVIIDDVIIAVRISTNDNDINNNYNIYYKEDKPKTYGW